MQYGITMFPTDETIGIVELGQAAEERGFESLFVPEHTHIPSSRQTPWPGGAALPREYSRTLDPFVALSAVAASTTRLRVGTGVCLVIQHDPIVLAKQVATLDYLSGGRFLFGVGGGWNVEEMANHGTAPASRWRLLRERVEAMKTIWTEDAASFHGEFVDFDAIWSWPKPVQQPHPPILVGGDAPGTLPRVVAYGDEWMPIIRAGTFTHLGERIAELQRLAAAAGRPPIPVSVITYGARPEPETAAALIALGVTRWVFSLPAAGAEAILPRLDRLAEGIARLG
jgi:probable F420-dependent oxidoreductase